jgi:enediyne biosynthesis protein E4
VRVDNKSLNGNERNVLLRNRGGLTPELVGAGYVAGVDRIEDSRGVGVLDIDHDGDLDMVVQGVEKPSILLVNQGPSGNYLEVRLRGTRSNRDAIGARIEARIGERMLLREVTSTGGFISGRSLSCHFGLGKAEAIDELVVYWPGGGTTKLRDVKANQRLRIVESGAANAGGDR